jgi:hypothetical protein
MSRARSPRPGEKRARQRRLQARPAVLAIDSSYEPVTRAGFHYRQANVYPYLASRGLSVRRCQGKLARRHFVSQEARKTDVVYLTGVGHGSETTFTGDNGDPIFSVGAYAPAEVAGKILHFLSCQTASLLGPDCVANGGKAYFGYDVNFTFVPKSRSVFFECDSAIDRAFARGLPADAVHALVTRLFKRRIRELSARGSDYTAAILETDLDHLCAPSVDARWGDTKARLT